MPMRAAHGYFEHDADMGIIGKGNTVEDSFVSAARAMFAIQTDLDSLKSGIFCASVDQNAVRRVS